MVECLCSVDPLLHLFRGGGDSTRLAFKHYRKLASFGALGICFYAPGGL